MRSQRPPAAVRDFVPPHCPFPDCEAHTIPEGTLFLFQRRGYRRTDRKPGWVRRFFCKHCWRFFSSSCFTGDYWKRVTGVDEAIYLGLANGQALRQIARSRQLSLGLVRRRERWLARQCLLWHELLLRDLEGKLDEPVALDGFRTFAMSQYEPLDLNTPVTTRSGFLLDLRAAPARRSGRMSEDQKARREQRDRWLGHPKRGVRVKATGQSLRVIARLWLNLTKGISERSARAAQITPAMVLGLTSEPLRGAELFSRRLFPTRVGLPEELREIYDGTIKARPSEPLWVEPLKYAY